MFVCDYVLEVSVYSMSRLSQHRRSAIAKLRSNRSLHRNFMFIFSLIFIINKLGIIQMTIFPAALSLCYHQPIQMKRSIIIAHVSHKQLVWGPQRNINTQ